MFCSKGQIVNNNMLLPVKISSVYNINEETLFSTYISLSTSRRVFNHIVLRFCPVRLCLSCFHIKNTFRVEKDNIQVMT